MNPKCKAFTCDTEDELRNKFKDIPDDIDILISHSPRWGMHDTVIDRDGYERYTGSMSLTRFVADHVHTLKIFVCGHIHEGYGVYDIRDIQTKIGDPHITISVNASHVDEFYDPVNKPVRIILEEKQVHPKEETLMG